MTKHTLADLKPDPRNARKHNPRNVGMIVDSLHQVGAARSIVIDEDNVILAGNGVVDAAAAAGIMDVRIIEESGNEIIAVRRSGLTAKQKTKLALFDNRTAELADWDVNILSDLDIDLAELFNEKELDALGLHDVKPIAWDDSELELLRADVPDAIWPTNNEWGVPLLDGNLQAKALAAPFGLWGALKRKSRMCGTWFFYTEDYRFEALWEDPSGVVNTKCVAVVEPNFSCYAEMPMAVGLWQIYRKRWLARYWQSFGIQIFADLNVNPKFYELNMLGIPQGWKAWATRGYVERWDDTVREYEMACERAGTDSILFVVYGGQQSTMPIKCQERGWLWVMEEMDSRG